MQGGPRSSNNTAAAAAAAEEERCCFDPSCSNIDNKYSKIKVAADRAMATGQLADPWTDGQVLGRGAFGVCHLVHNAEQKEFAMKEVALQLEVGCCIERVGFGRADIAGRVGRGCMQVGGARSSNHVEAAAPKYCELLWFVFG